MGNNGDLQIGDIKKKKTSLNQSGGINTEKSIFETGDNYGPQSPGVTQVTRVEQLANQGPLQKSRWQVTNRNDIAMKELPESVRKTGAHKNEEGHIRSEQKSNVLKAQPDLKVFTGEVVKKGVFTPKAKEAARHFFKQVCDWAGSFDDGGSGFYGQMGIANVLDCLYVDGMSLRTFIRDQYLYKATGNPAHQQETLRNYVALIAARGNHVITLVRPNLKGKGAEVEYRNLMVDLANVGSAEASRAKKLKEKGNQIRNDLRKRIDGEMTERAGMAYRKAYGIKMDGMERLESAKGGLDGAGQPESSEYKSFKKSFDHYSGGMQKLGLIPGRDDINLEAAEEMKKRCEAAIADADICLGSKDIPADTRKAVEKAKKELETDLILLERAIETKLTDERVRMRFDELTDSRNLNPDEGKGDNTGSEGSGDDKGAGDGDSNEE